MLRLRPRLLDRKEAPGEATHHDRVARRRNQVVTLLHDEAVLTTVVAELFHPLVIATATKDLEASRLHSLQHFNDASLDAIATSIVRGGLAEHLQAVRLVLSGQLSSRALVVLQAVVGPSAGNPIAQGLTAATWIGGVTFDLR